MAIIRVRHNAENPYFQGLRETAQNKALTYEARGMLMYLLSKPDDWTVQPKDLECEGTGRDRVYRILKELIEARHIVHDKIRMEDGTFKWGDYIAYEAPLPENPDMDEPDLEKPDITYTESTEERTTKRSAVSSTAVYGSYKDRVPPAVAGSPEGEGGEKGYVTLNSPNLPAIAYSVFAVLDAVKSPAQKRISEAQMKLLRQPVSTPSGLLPSPYEEAETYETEWKAFVEGLPDMASWKKRTEELREKITVKLIVDHLRGYHWIGGWLEYKSDGPAHVSNTTSDAEDEAWLKAMLG